MLRVNQLSGFGVGLQALEVAFHASATSTGASVTGPATIQAGDLLILKDRASSSSGAVPTQVIPSGFTQISQQTGSLPAALGYRSIISYKIADGSEASASITGMNGNSTNRKELLVFRGNKPITAVSIQDVDNGSATDGDPAGQTITSASGVTPLIAMASWATSAGPPVVDPRSFTPAKDGEVNSASNSYTAYKIYNSSPADISVDMEDEGSIGSFNILQSFYLQLS